MWVSATHALKEEMHVINWLVAQNKDPGSYQVGAIGEGEIPKVSSWGSGIHLRGIGIHQ